MKRINNNSLISVENNKNSNIQINCYGELDELSCDNIRRNYNKVVELEEEFSERLKYSKEILTKKLLPKQLQSDFNIETKLVDGEIEYIAKPITENAYKKFPLRLNYTMQFNSVEEANEFRINGIEKLQKEADITQKPVEIPNITNMKEFLGEYENPVAHTTKYGCQGIKLYICPRPIPPAQKYKIELFNEYLSFELITFLRLDSIKDKEFILSNKENDTEEFDVIIKFDNLQEEVNELNCTGKFNISISLRDKYKNDCKLNKEKLKFLFLCEDKNNHLYIKNINMDCNVFETSNNGKKEKNEKDYEEFNNVLSLIDKVIYISKIENIKIPYDIKYFIEKEELINLIYYEMNNKKYTIQKEMKSLVNFESEIDVEEIKKYNGNLAYRTNLKEISLFGQKFELKRNNMIMFESKISKIVNKRKIELKSSHIEFYTDEELKNN